jgi:CRP-like cAMP-binding protein
VIGLSAHPLRRYGAAVVSPDELAGIPLFDALDDAQRVELASWFDSRSFDAGAVLVDEGSAGYSFFVMAEGSAVVTAGETTIRELGRGDFFGEIAILERRRRSATVTATTPTRLLVMFGWDFRSLQESQPAIAERIEEAMQRRLAADPSA